MEPDAHRQAVRPRRAREVQHLAGDELAVGDEDRIPVLGDDARRPPADLDDPTHAVADLDPVAVAERAVELQAEAAKDVRERRLESQPDDGRQHRRGRHQREEVEAGEAEKAHDERDRHGNEEQVADDRRHVHPEPGEHEVEEDKPRERDEADAEHEHADDLDERP